MMLKHEREELKHYFDGKEPMGEEHCIDGGFDENIEFIAKDNSWGGNFPLIAMAGGYGCPIITLSERMPSASIQQRRGRSACVPMVRRGRQALLITDRHPNLQRQRRKCRH